MFGRSLERGLSGRKDELIRFGSVLLLDILLLLPLLVFGQAHYQYDTYLIEMDSGVHYSFFIGSYRFVGAFLFWLLKLIGHDPIADPMPSTVSMIVMSALGVASLTVLFYKKTRGGVDGKSLSLFVLINVSLLITAVNVFYCQLFTFPECIFLSGVGYLLCALSVVVYAEFDGIWGKLGAAALIICCVGIFQQFISLTVVFLMILFCSEICGDRFEKRSRAVLWLVKAFTTVFAGLVVYFIAAKIVQSSFAIESLDRAVLNLNDVLENIGYYAVKQGSYINGRGWFSIRIMTALFLCSSALWGVSFVLYFLKRKRVFDSVVIALCVAVGYVGTYFMGILAAKHNERALFPIFAVYVLLSVTAAAMTDKSWIRSLFVAVAVLAFCVNVGKVEKMEIDQQKTDLNDRIYMNELVSELNEYETQSGKTITRVEVYVEAKRDRPDTYLYDLYGFSATLRYYSKRDFDFEMHDDPAETPEFFRTAEMTELIPVEQFLFNGDTLYVLLY